MLLRWFSVFIAGCVLTVAFPAMAARRASSTAGDPTVKSVFPFTGQIGATFLATVRGTNLATPTSVCVEGAPFTATIESDGAGLPPLATAPTSQEKARDKAPEDSVRLRVHVQPDAKPGRYSFRLMTSRGISNALSLYVVSQPIL